MNPDKIGKFIAELRKEKNITQQQLADTLYVTRESVSKWERGVNTPEIPTMIVISKFFNISVNELIAGERVTPENRDKIENIALNILEFSKSKINRIKILTVAIILMLLILFLIIYFIYNYNSLKVYLISSQGNKFELSQGIIVTSKQKSYISLGNLVNNTNEVVDNIILYYENKDTKKVLLETTEINSLTIDLHEYNEFVKVESISEIVSHLYIDVITVNEVYKIPLKSKLDYSNSYIIPFMFKKNETKEENMLQVAKNLNIPIFIQNKFNYENNQYIYYYEENNIKYKCWYDNLSFIYIEKTNDEELSIYYDLNENIINVYNDKINVKYSYNDEKCIEGKCKIYKNIINSFAENVLN